MMASGEARTVSFDDEPLILVDSQDRVLGHMDKAEAHKGAGTLHRAFSIFVFRSDGRLLLQQRAPGKRLWGGYWSNTCCSHPRRGESLETATHRRLEEELGLDCPLRFLFRFEYQAQFDDDGAEHELCAVYAGVSDAEPAYNPSEIAAVQYISPEALDRRMQEAPESLTPWFRMEWARMRREHAELFTPEGRRNMAGNTGATVRS